MAHKQQEKITMFRGVRALSQAILKMMSSSYVKNRRKN